MVPANIRIVLVRPTHPGNVGATARAMKNMALRSLYLIEPEKFPSPEATDRAAGADDVLESAVICASLDEALKDCHLVIGTTARAPHRMAHARPGGRRQPLGGGGAARAGGAVVRSGAHRLA